MVGGKQTFPAVTFCNINPYKKSQLHNVPQMQNLVMIIFMKLSSNSLKVGSHNLGVNGSQFMYEDVIYRPNFIQLTVPS